MLIKFHCKQQKINKHQFIGDFIKKEKALQLAELIMEVTGVELKWMKRRQKELLKSKPQVKPIPNAISFCSTPKYTKDDTD